MAFSASILASTAAAQMLPGSEWAPTEMNGVTIPAEPEVFLRFEQDARYFGTGGCNSIRGQFVTNGDAILFGPSAATMMACPEEIMKRENEFLKTISVARLFTRDGTTLTLSDAAGDVLMRLRQRDAD